MDAEGGNELKSQVNLSKPGHPLRLRCGPIFVLSLSKNLLTSCHSANLMPSIVNELPVLFGPDTQLNIEIFARRRGMKCMNRNSDRPKIPQYFCNCVRTPH